LKVGYDLAAKPALEALRAFQDFLKNDLSKRHDGDWRLGREKYEAKFRPRSRNRSQARRNTGRSRSGREDNPSPDVGAGAAVVSQTESGQADDTRQRGAAKLRIIEQQLLDRLHQRRNNNNESN